MKYRPSPALAIALCASVSIHVLPLLALRFWKLPELGIEFATPNEVDFGVESDEPEAASDEVTATEARPDENAATSEAPPKSGTVLANTAPKRAEQNPSAPVSKSRNTGQAPPAGALIALWLNVATIRDSAIAPDIQNILKNVQDWDDTLSGSGINPIEDLDTLLIASSDFQPRNMLIAGKHHFSENYTDEKVAAMAATTGKAADWKAREDIQVAPWRTASGPRRYVTKLGPQTFALGSLSKLPRFVAALQELESAIKPGSKAKTLDQAIRLPENTLATLHVANARAFVIGGDKRIPGQVIIRAEEQKGGRYLISVDAQYPNAAEAQFAEAFWKQVRDRYGNDALLALLGIGSSVRRAEIKHNAENLSIQLSLEQQAARMMLAYVEGRLVSTTRIRSTPTLSPADEPESQPAHSQSSAEPPANAAPASSSSATEDTELLNAPSQ